MRLMRTRGHERTSCKTLCWPGKEAAVGTCTVWLRGSMVLCHTGRKATWNVMLVLQRGSLKAVSTKAEK